MSNWVTVTAENLSAWKDYFDRLDDPGPYHSPEYVTRLAGNFEHPEEIAEAFVLDTSDGLVYYPYLRRSLSTVPFADEIDLDLTTYEDIVSSWYYGGPILTTDDDGDEDALAEEFVDAFAEHCRDRGIVAEFVRFDPNRGNQERFDQLEPQFNRETVPVDLTGSVEDIWQGYEDRNRRAINQARETEIVVESTRSADDVSAFHDIYSNAMEARDADDHYRFSETFFESLLEDHDLATLLVARYEDSVIGGFIVVHDDRISHHFLSASNPDYWDMRVNNLLYHEVVLHMHETGRDVFDFQGGRPGVFKFKKGFSPDRREFYIGKRTHRPEIYDELVEAAGRYGLDTETGYFPAYRVEQSN